MVSFAWDCAAAPELLWLLAGEHPMNWCQHKVETASAEAHRGDEGVGEGLEDIFTQLQSCLQIILILAFSVSISINHYPKTRKLNLLCFYP